MRDTDGERRSLSRGEWAAVVLAVVVVAAAAWMWLRKPARPPAAVQPTADTTDSQQEQPVPAVAQETPPAAVSDEQARTQLEALSSDPAFRRWLAAADDIVRRWATATDNIAEGVSPRKVLGLIGPKAPFRAVRRGGKDYLSPESCARYDEFARAVSSIDAQAFVGVYRSLKPAIEYAYRALGYPNGSLDAVTSRALRRILDAPAVDGQVELVPDRGVYVFADPKLEGLTQVDKHLLRMGPRNTRLVQAKARQLREALAFPAEAASAK
jgi:hypothetical protein